MKIKTNLRAGAGGRCAGGGGGGSTNSGGVNGGGASGIGHNSTTPTPVPVSRCAGV